MAESFAGISDFAIAKVRGREVLDSRGEPTVEAEVILGCGISGVAAAPSGASVGSGEAVELRDGGDRLRGRGTRRAAENLSSEISRALVGVDARNVKVIDNALLEVDGGDKSRLGANAVLAASVASALAAAKFCQQPLYAFLGSGTTLPVPMMNIINGGAHAKNNLDVQEFMIVPAGFSDFESALFAGVEVFHKLKEMLAKRNLATSVGDEGGFAPDLRGAEEALDLLTEAIGRAGLEPGRQVSIALDCAASELFADGEYQLPGEKFSGDCGQWVDKLVDWRARYPIVSIEDGCAEDDFAGWRMLSDRLGGETQLVGDDLFVTDCARLQKGIEAKVANALLAKPNQIGTLSETLQAVRMAQSANYNVIMSHRSGETEHAELADLAVAWDAGQIKTGAPCRGERTAKYNRLLRICEELGSDAKFAGAAVWERTHDRTQESIQESISEHLQ